MMVLADEVRLVPAALLPSRGEVPYSTMLSVLDEVSQQTHMEEGEGSCR
jgi:hypothetical protein